MGEPLVPGELQEDGLEVDLVGTQLRDVQASLRERGASPGRPRRRAAGPGAGPSARVTGMPASVSTRAPASRSSTRAISPSAPPRARTSRTGPSFTSRPRARMATRSAVCWISDRMWLETKTVRPSAPSRRTSSRTSTMPAGSRPFAGSSRISSAGSFSSAAADPEPLLHPERVGLHAIVGALGQAHDLQHVRDGLRADALDRAEDLQVPPPGEAREHRGRLDDRADASDHRGEPARHVRAEQLQPPGARGHESQQTPDRGGLAGAVRPEEPEHATLGHGQVEAGHGDRAPAAQAPILLVQPLDLDDGHGAPTLPRRDVRRYGLRCMRMPARSDYVRPPGRSIPLFGGTAIPSEAPWTSNAPSATPPSSAAP